MIAVGGGKALGFWGEWASHARDFTADTRRMARAAARCGIEIGAVMPAGPDNRDLVWDMLLNIAAEYGAVVPALVVPSAEHLAPRFADINRHMTIVTASPHTVHRRTGADT